MTIIRLLTASLLLAASILTASASGVPTDSVTRPLHPRGEPSALRIIGAATGAGLLLEGAIGAAVHSDASLSVAKPAGGNTVADVAQYLPLAFPWAMKAFGAPVRSSWGRMAVSQAFGTAFMAGGVYLTKHAVNQPRPDLSDNHSFPSGHAAWAFMGATMTAIELGDASPWYAAGAYAVATGVAVQRVVAHRHFPTDVVAGAGIGILAAELGYYLGDVIFGQRGLDHPTPPFIPDDARSFSLALTTRMLWPTSTTLSCPGGKIKTLPAISAGVTASLALPRHWSLGLSAMMQSTPLQTAAGGVTANAGTLNAIGVELSPGYEWQAGKRVSLTAALSGGYYMNLSLKTTDGSLSSGSGTPTGRLEAGARIRLTNRLSCNASLGYQLSHYSYTLSSPVSASAGGSHTLSGTAGALTIGVATCVNL